jgi:hypothetical protein
LDSQLPAVREQHQNHTSRLDTDNKVHQFEKIRMEQKRQLGEKIVLAALADQSYANAHDWKQTRYAGVFTI